MPVPLPLLEQTQLETIREPVELGDDVRSAYSLARAAERDATNDVAQMHARIVGHLMITLAEFRTTLPEALPKVANEVVSSPHGAASGETIYALGQRYRDFLLRAFRQPKGPIPPSSNHGSRPSFETLQDMMNSCLEGSATDHESLKQHVLARDNFRCVFSQAVDIASLQLCPAIEDGDELTERHTQLCHILSSSSIERLEPEGRPRDKNREYESHVLAILKGLGLGDLTDKLLGVNGVHCPQNALTVATELHQLFDELLLALEPTGTPNKYKVRPYLRSFWRTHPDVPETITFESHACDPISGKLLTLPAPELLAIHAACARVAHMAGAAQYFDRLDWEAEETDTLAGDGSTHELLVSLLAPFAGPVP